MRGCRQRRPAAQRWPGYQRWNGRAGGSRGFVVTDCELPEDPLLMEVVFRMLLNPDPEAPEPMA